MYDRYELQRDHITPVVVSLAHLLGFWVAFKACARVGEFKKVVTGRRANVTLDRTPVLDCEFQYRYVTSHFFEFWSSLREKRMGRQR